MTDLKYHLDSAVWVLLGELNALKNCAQSNGGLTTMLSEVDVRFITLLSLFDRTGRRKIELTDLKYHLDSAM